MLYETWSERIRRTMVLRPLAALAAVGAAALVIGGCGGSSTSSTVSFSHEIAFEELLEIVGDGGGPWRVEVELPRGSDTAEEVDLEGSGEVFDKEKIEGRAVGFASDDCDAGTVTLAVGAFEIDVDFNRSTRFETENGGEEDTTCEEFVAWVQQEIEGGGLPGVEAERPPMIPAQAPFDPSFFATDLEAEHEDDDDHENDTHGSNGDDDQDDRDDDDDSDEDADERSGSEDDGDEDEIEINIDGDNLAHGPGEGDGAIVVLNLQIRVRHGLTDIEAEDEDEETDFEGPVDCATVDPGDGTFALSGGPVIEIGPGTEVEGESDDEGLISLRDVEAACDAGLTVEAEGEGVVQTTAPLTLFATEVEFEVED